MFYQHVDLLHVIYYTAFASLGFAGSREQL